MKRRTHQWSDSMLRDRHPTQWCRHQRGLAWQEAPPPRRRWSPVQYVPSPAKRQHAEAVGASTSLELGACCVPGRISDCWLPWRLSGLTTFAADQRPSLRSSAPHLRRLVQAGRCVKTDRYWRSTRYWYEPRGRPQTTLGQHSLPWQSPRFQAQLLTPCHDCLVVPRAQFPTFPLAQPLLAHDQ